MKLALVLLCLTSCARPEPLPGAAGPIESVQELAMALQRGDGARAFSLLSSKTRAEADGMARAAHPDAGADAAQQMLFALLAPLPKPLPPEARVLSEPGDEALVQVTGAGQPPQSFRVVREGGLWRVELALARSPQDPQNQPQQPNSQPNPQPH